ncbi:MAG: hypothetical protein RLP09_01300 [Sandaracinaceae bacterium]
MTRFVFVVCCLLVSGCAFIDDFSRFEVDPNRADAGDAGTPPDARVIDAPGCVARPETCNGEDDDCDGTTDEEPTECSSPNGLVGCVAGSCEMTECVGGFEDCTDEPGCETDPTSDAEHCGGCGMGCLTGQLCTASTCAYPRITAHYILEGTGNSALRHVATDATSAIVVAGTSGGDGTLAETPVAAPGDIVARIEPSGTVDWIAPSPIFANDIAVIPTGVVYVAGSYSGTLAFGAGTTSSRGGTVDAAILSYEPNGAPRNVHAAGSSTGSDSLNGIDVRDGRWAFVGSADGALQGETHAGGRDAFAGASLSDLGPFPEQYGGTESDVLYGVALASDGGYTVIGRYGGSADFGGTMPAPDYMERFSTTSLIIASYTLEATQTWQLTLPRYYAESGNRAQVAVDRDGNVYWTAGLTGGTADRPDLGTGPLPGLFVIASYTADGVLRWAVSTSANVSDSSISLSSDESLLYLAGDYFGTSEVIPGGDPFPDGGETDCAVLALETETGELRWGTTITSADSVRCEGVAAQGPGVWVAGSFRGTVNFGGELATAAVGTNDGFVAFLEP